MTDLQLLAVPVDELAPSPFNRNVINDDSLKELTASIAANGVLQALTVRPSSRTGVKYEIVIGEHRWRAAIKAKLATVPCSLVTATDTEAILMQLEENLKRKDPNALEVGASYLHLSKLGLKPDEIAKKSGKSLAHVYAHLSLNKASEVLRNAVADGSITGSHAGRLVSMPEKEQKDWVERIKRQGMSVHDFEKNLSCDYKKLSAAPWKLTDALFEAGACSVCPKSTTCNDELRARLNVKAGICTDSECYEHKGDVLIDRLIVEQQALGVKLVRLTESWWWRPATKKDKKKKVKSGVVDIPGHKDYATIVKFIDTRYKPKREKSDKPRVSYEEQTRRHKARAKQETIWRSQVYAELKKKIPKELGPVELRVIEEKLRLETGGGKVAGTITQRLVQLAVREEVRVQYYNIRPAKYLLTLAKRYKINVKKIQSELTPKAKKKGKAHVANE
jgi:ParB/RepB/Spo0J family partition protein